MPGINSSFNKYPQIKSIISTLSENDKLAMYVLSSFENNEREFQQKKLNSQYKIDLTDMFKNYPGVSVQKLNKSRTKFKGYPQNESTYELIFQDIILCFSANKIIQYTEAKVLIMAYLKTLTLSAINLKTVKRNNKEHLSLIVRQYQMTNVTYMKHHFQKLVRDVAYFNKQPMSLPEYEEELKNNLKTDELLHKMFKIIVQDGITKLPPASKIHDEIVQIDNPVIEIGFQTKKEVKEDESVFSTDNIKRVLNQVQSLDEEEGKVFKHEQDGPYTYSTEGWDEDEDEDDCWDDEDPDMDYLLKLIKNNKLTEKEK